MEIKSHTQQYRNVPSSKERPSRFFRPFVFGSVCIIKNWRRLVKKKTFIMKNMLLWCKKKSEEKIVSCIIKFEEKHFFVQLKGNGERSNMWYGGGWTGGFGIIFGKKYHESWDFRFELSMKISLDRFLYIFSSTVASLFEEFSVQRSFFVKFLKI